MSVTIPEAALAALEKTNPICIATADKDGKPNLVYVTYLKALDDKTLIVADNKFDKTRKNLDTNPVATVVALDPDTRKAYQFKGTVVCHIDDAVHTDTIEWVHVNHPHLTPKAAFTIDVEEVYTGAVKLA